MPTWSRVTLLVTVVTALFAGCGVTIPTDPEGTLERVSGGTLRVGVSPNPPWTEVTQGAEPTGTEVRLVEEFAPPSGGDQLDGWRRGDPDQDAGDR